ncbi:MAG: phenylalanine--tRNA ligase subunit beta [Christensenellales bacterium]
MLVPISWLKDYVDIRVSPETLAKKLVAIGFEVEDIIYQNRQATNVVVGKITDVEKHPNADRLRVTRIDVGTKTIQVVTNVPVQGGETVAVALDGATLADGHKIVKGELRGVVSEGMLCGLEEVGITEDDALGQKTGDILRFEEGTTLGINALDALGFNDVVLDVSVTANRPDCNSIYKMAKEVAVALKTSCKEPEIDYKTVGGSVNDMVSVEVQNQTLCPRYMAAGVKNIRIFPSSQKIKSRLRAVGIRPINNVVDITNYVLTEIGQPMHSFDKRELEGDRIIVRNAREGETIVTLDGKENKLNDSMLVICDSVRPVAVAGIMGGENSGIREDTTQVVFESAKFARDNVRRTSRALNLRSDSSARYEKGIDFASQEYGLKRALTLVYQSGSGDIVDGIIDVKTDYQKTREIKFTTKKLQQILGCKVPKSAVVTILERLGIKVEERDKCLVALVKEDREDVVGVNDIAEEFIRVYGYSHIKPTLFEYSALTKGGIGDKVKFANIVKDTLCACGLSECVTYSFTSPKFADMMNLEKDDKARNTIKILNPLGEALSVMRTTLSHSMIETLCYNITHFNKGAKLFEIANVYLPMSLPLEELPDEEQRLCVGMYDENVDFFTLKGALENAFNALHLDVEYVRSSRPYLHPGRSAEVIANGKSVGFLGEIHPDVADNYGVDQRLYVAEISLDAVFDEKLLDKKQYVAFSKFPNILRDLAVVVDDDVLAGDMINAVKRAKIKHLCDVSVFDTYKSDQIGKGKKSVAMSFAFASLERTLTDDEIATEMAKILGVLKRKVGAKIR